MCNTLKISIFSGAVNKTALEISDNKQYFCKKKEKSNNGLEQKLF